MSKYFFFLILYSSVLFCQVSSLDIDFDAVSISMGESFTASPYGVLTGDQNPASLSLHKNLSFSFSRRSMNWFRGLDELVYLSGAAAVPTKIGSFSLIYKRFNYGEQRISTIENPDGTEKANVYDHSIILSYSNQMAENLFGGVNIKTTHFSDIGKYKYNYPVMIDAGLLYSIDGPIQKSGTSDKIYFGTVLQNFGTDYTIKSPTEEYYYKVPRYFKLGMCYTLNIEDDETNLFRFVFTAEYKNNVNGPGYLKDYWGMGFESTFFDMLSLRMGGITRPHSSIYNQRGNMAIRYGAGLNIPFKRLGLNSPLSLAVDYAVIPLFVIDYFDQQKDNLFAFNLQLKYSM